MFSQAQQALLTQRLTSNRTISTKLLRRWLHLHKLDYQYEIPAVCFTESLKHCHRPVHLQIGLLVQNDRSIFH